ncbi:MAG: CinA family protein [Muribaculaceae bacterium]|nr:CinA family protein [Muribaculaceae bacterium]
MEQKLIEFLRKRSLTMATAESCTGGNIAHRITLVPGASDVFPGGIVSYANRVKTDMLGVEVEAIRLEGAVSQTVVTAMAEGVCRAMGVDCGVATSGIAGPAGGSAAKPVGTVWMAVAMRGLPTVSRLCHFSGSRSEIITQASNAAIEMLYQRLERVYDNKN